MQTMLILMQLLNSPFFFHSPIFTVKPTIDMPYLKVLGWTSSHISFLKWNKSIKSEALRQKRWFQFTHCELSIYM